MRLIDADALKKDLTRFYDNEVTARALIDEQPTASVWISVNDRLPENETTVLAFVQHKIGWYRMFAWHDEHGWHSSAAEFEERESKFVTHWMPLPEPPEEREDDADI